MQRIQDAQAHLSELMTHLEGRLEPVCPPEPENSRADKEERGPCCGMEDRLMDIERGVVSARDRVESLLRRLKI